MNPFVRLTSAFVVFGIKYFSKLFYKTEARWLTPVDQMQWEKLRLVVILNHTSLFEPLFIAAIPNIRLWRATRRFVIPVADVTINRPFVGHLFKILVPNAIPITRKRDETWNQVMKKIEGDSVMAIFPEGRMKRANGLDKDGNPMSVKGGVADILAQLQGGKILVAYSGGLHHVQAPGQNLPKLFKTIKVTFEELDIVEYKVRLAGQDHLQFRKNVIADLEGRMALYCN